MTEVTGPISTLPGAQHSVPVGTMCDTHPQMPATHRVQEETDSFGSELNDMCAVCFAEYSQERDERFAEESYCDYCKTMQFNCSPMRDYEEGMSGPVYTVCPSCRQRTNARIAEELDDRFEDAYNDDREEDDEDRTNR